jgi:hypothetical protein
MSTAQLIYECMQQKVAFIDSPFRTVRPATEMTARTTNVESEGAVASVVYVPAVLTICNSVFCILLCKQRLFP